MLGDGGLKRGVKAIDSVMLIYGDVFFEDDDDLCPGSEAVMMLERYESFISSYSCDWLIEFKRKCYYACYCELDGFPPLHMSFSVFLG